MVPLMSSQVLDSTEPFQRDAMAPFRMPVIDKYKEMGTIVMGKSESGLVTVGDKLLVMPNKCAPALIAGPHVSELRHFPHPAPALTHRVTSRGDANLTAIHRRVPMQGTDSEPGSHA